MTRSRASAKAAGTSFETLMARFFRVERRARNGAKDRGDLNGLFAVDNPYKRIVIECKDYGGRLQAGPWLNEAEKERLNDGALVGVVVAKRRGTTDPAEQFVLMSAADFVALITGERP